MLTPYPVDSAAFRPPPPAQLRRAATRQELLPLGDQVDSTDAGVSSHLSQPVFLLAFALHLAANTCSPDVSFLHTEALPSSAQDVREFKECHVAIKDDLFILDILGKIEDDSFPPPKRYSHVPSLLLKTNSIEHLPSGLDVPSSLVVAYFFDGTGSRSLSFCFHYDPSAISAQAVDRMSSQFTHLLRQVVQPQILRVGEMKILGAEDIAKLQLWNGRPQYRDYRTVHDRINEWAELRPHEVAICAWDAEMTRLDLDRASSNIARHLAQHGCRRGDTAAVLIQKSVWTPVSLLAVMKTGSAFILLDQDLPLERLKTMIAKVPCSHVVASRENAALASRLSIPNIICLDGDGQPTSHRGVTVQQEQSCVSTPDDTLFYCFTSGSSGSPKAAEIEHFAWSSGYRPDAVPFLAEKGVRVLHRASFNFIVSVVELIVPLMNGGTVCIPSAEELLNDLTGAIRRLKPTCVAVPPSLAKTLNPEDLPSINTMVLVGEPSPSSLTRRWIDSHIEHVVNGFGSTEGCSYTSLRSIPVSDMSSTNIGKSTSRRYWIVDPRDHNVLVPIGGTGELLIEGYSIAKRYFQDPEKSAQAFIPGPKWIRNFEAGQGDQRWYKTGDLVKYTDEGELLLLGRKDFQVKLHGQRIEPAEVENQLLSMFSDQIQNVIVDLALIGNDQNNPRLTAFIVLRKALEMDVGLDAFRHQVRERLGQVLPSFMVPTQIRVIDALPKTPSGKINRRELRSLELHIASKEVPESKGHDNWPCDQQCILLRKTWAETLGVPESDISQDSSWRDLGGDSLTAISLSQKAREKGISLSVANILQHSTLRELASTVQSEGQDMGPLDGHSLQRSVTLVPKAITSFQEYTLNMSASTNRALIYYYNINIRGSVSIEVLEIAVRRVFDQYDSLRIRFDIQAISQSKATQTVHSMDDFEVQRRIKIVQCANADEEAHRRLKSLYASDEICPSLPALWMLLVSSGKTRMLVCFHHALEDATSMMLIWKAFQQAIESPTSRTSRPQFLPYLEKRLLPRSSGSIEYWRTLLRGSKPTMLRKTAAELADNNGSIADISATRIVVLDLDQPRSATISTLVKAAWAVNLAGMTDSRDVVFYHLLNGRDETVLGSLDVVGCCVTEVVMRVQLVASHTAEDLLLQVQDQILDSMPHAHLGADVIAKQCSDWAEEIVYRHSSFVHHHSSKDVAHFPIGDEAYADVETFVRDDTIMDISLTSSSLKGDAVEIKLEASKQWYSQEELDMAADCLVATISILDSEPRKSVESIMAGLRFMRL